MELGSRDGSVWEDTPPINVTRVSPGLGVICELSLLLVLVFAPLGFSPGTSVFPYPQKPTFPNSNLIRNLRAINLSIVTDY